MSTLINDNIWWNAKLSIYPSTQLTWDFATSVGSMVTLTVRVSPAARSIRSSPNFKAQCTGWPTFNGYPEIDIIITTHTKYHVTHNCDSEKTTPQFMNNSSRYYSNLSIQNDSKIYSLKYMYNTHAVSKYIIPITINFDITILVSKSIIVLQS